MLRLPSLPVLSGCELQLTCAGAVGHELRHVCMRHCSHAILPNVALLALRVLVLQVRGLSVILLHTLLLVTLSLLVLCKSKLGTLLNCCPDCWTHGCTCASPALLSYIMLPWSGRLKVAPALLYNNADSVGAATVLLLTTSTACSEAQQPQMRQSSKPGTSDSSSEICMHNTESVCVSAQHVCM